jgi:hypothetical protein
MLLSSSPEKHFVLPAKQDIGIKILTFKQFRMLFLIHPVSPSVLRLFLRMRPAATGTARHRHRVPCFSGPFRFPVQQRVTAEHENNIIIRLMLLNVSFPSPAKKCVAFRNQAGTIIDMNFMHVFRLYNQISRINNGKLLPLWP